MSSQKQIGQILQSRRKDLNISQIDLADIAGVSVRTLRTIESGTGNPSLETLLKIGEVLGMELILQVKRSI